jgi:hypothetical protein
MLFNALISDAAAPVAKTILITRKKVNLQHFQHLNKLNKSTGLE